MLVRCAWGEWLGWEGGWIVPRTDVLSVLLYYGTSAHHSPFSSTNLPRSHFPYLLDVSFPFYESPTLDYLSIASKMIHPYIT